MRVTVRWNQTAEAGLYRVVGYVDGRKELDTHYRFQTEQALRGMLAHDLAHVSLGVGFTIAEEATVRCAKLNYRYIARIDRATAAILKGENVVLR